MTGCCFDAFLKISIVSRRPPIKPSYPRRSGSKTNRMSRIAGRCLVRCALVLLASVNFCASYVDLGQIISENVNRHLAPLQNLGPQISENVNRHLAPLQNLGPQISNSVNQELYRNGLMGHRYHGREFRGRFGADADDAFVPDIGSRISDEVQESLRPLQNLGPQIQHNVYQSLEPVRALEIVVRMKNGVGGNTVKTFQPGGKTFIRKNGHTYTCGGTISSDDGHCRGNLVPFKAQSKEDQCFAEQRAYLKTDDGDYICVAVDGFATVSVINGKIVCEGQGSPATLFSKSEYNALCGNVATTVKYQYYADSSDPMHVEIPSKNRYVKCDNSKPGYCEFTEDEMAPGGAYSIVVSGGQNFQSTNFQNTLHGTHINIQN